MSTSYWAVKGMGFALEDISFDANKIVEAYKDDIDFMDCLEEDYNDSDVLYVFKESFQEDQNIEFVSSSMKEKLGVFPCIICDGDNDYYIVTAKFPWDYKGKAKHITKEQLRDVFCKELSKITKQTEQELKELFTFISTGGKG